MQKGNKVGKMVLVAAAALLLAMPVMAGNGNGGGGNGGGGGGKGGGGSGDRDRDGSCLEAIELGSQQLAARGDMLKLFLRDKIKDQDQLQDDSCLG